jgi:hypothetical protein
MAELARELFGLRLSTGAVDAICQRASQALAGPHTQLQDWVLEQDTVPSMRPAGGRRVSAVRAGP